MRDLQFKRFRKQLLRGGVAPKYVTRAIREMRDHYLDLEQEATLNGMSSKEASEYAWLNLGDQNMLAERTLAQSELRSWVSRWPWAFYTAGPLLALIFLVSALVLSCVGLAAVLELGKAAWPIPAGYRMTGDALFLFITYGLTPMVATALVVFAQNREAPMLWPLLGAFLVALAGSALTATLVWPPAAGELGAIGLSLGYGILEPPYDDGNSANQLKLGVVLLIVYTFTYCRHIKKERETA